MDKCEELHANVIQPLNDKSAGPLEKLNTGGYQVRTSQLQTFGK